MGAYLKFKLADSVEATPKAVNDWLDNQPEQEQLDPIDHGQQVYFWDRRDQEWWDNEHSTSYHLNIGEGNLKASCTPSKAKDLWAALFQKLHAEYDMKVLSSSCAMTLDHLTSGQLKRISNGGNALSGSENEQARVRELLAGQETQ